MSTLYQDFKNKNEEIKLYKNKTRDQLNDRTGVRECCAAEGKRTSQLHIF